MRKEIATGEILYFSKFHKEAELKKFADATGVNSVILAKAQEAHAAKEFDKDVVFICLAVTSEEFYGPNDNGDSFVEEPIGSVLGMEDTLTACYKTFEDGRVYRYHQSESEENAIGDIIFAFWNEDQHRVELVCKMKWDKAPSECIKIRRGLRLSVSMGTSVKSDICSVCGQVAIVAADHCNHVKYELLSIVDGIPVAMINVHPKYEDLSIVVIGGDMNAAVMHHF